MNEPREINWLQELVKQSPLLGSGVLLILSASTGVVPGFGPVQQAWQVFLGIVGTGLVIAGVVLLYRVQYPISTPMPKQAIKETPSDKKIPVFSTKHQTTDIFVRENGLELVFKDTRYPEKFRKQFLDIEALQHIYDNGKIKVVPKSSRSPNWGVVTVGPWLNWLYSKEINPNPKGLYSRIFDAIEGILQRNNNQRKS